jgi:1-acyl-sn-glycerol-3-phosphate acyltransferase
MNKKKYLFVRESLVNFPDDIRSFKDLRFNPLHTKYNYRVGNSPNLFYRVIRDLNKSIAKVIYKRTSSNEEILQKIDQLGKGIILISNHDSGYDPVFVVGSMKSRLHTFALDNPFWDFFGIAEFFRKMAAIPVAARGNPKTMLIAREMLDREYALLVFPEANFVHKYRQIYGRTGFVRLAISANKPILPVGIQGVDHNHFVDFFPPLNRRIHVVYDKPYRIKDEFVNVYNSEPNEILLREIRDELMFKMRKYSKFSGLLPSHRNQLINYYKKNKENKFLIPDPDYA